MFDKALQSIKNTFKETFKVNLYRGYGYVYEVSDNRGNKYALKKMNILSETQYKQIKKEIQIWKQISNNKNIVKIIDYSSNEKEVDILMELCTEGSLLDYINNYEGNINEKEALRIIKEISNGLYGMHSQKPPIAHRDVKIENILKFGNNFKLCDFGSASSDIMIPQNETKQSLRDKFDIYEKTTTFMYRAPEMIDEYSKYIVNEKVDVWALGCILFTILFKQHPFQDAQKLTIATADYYIPKDANKYSDKIFDFIRLMLTPNPNNRPNISQVLQYLNNWNNINNIPLSNEVINIKNRQIKIFNEKKNSNSNKEISMEDLEKAKLAIMKDLKKKNKYKKKDNSDLNDIFADDDEGYEKYDEGNNQKKPNLIDTKNTNQNKPILFDFNSQFVNNNNNQQNNSNFGFDFNNNFTNNNRSNQNQNQFQNNNNMGFNFQQNMNNNNQQNNFNFNFDQFTNNNNNTQQINNNMNKNMNYNNQQQFNMNNNNMNYSNPPQFNMNYSNQQQQNYNINNQQNNNNMNMGFNFNINNNNTFNNNNFNTMNFQPLQENIPQQQQSNNQNTQNIFDFFNQQ